jgi:hypothetical protein
MRADARCLSAANRAKNEDCEDEWKVFGGHGAPPRNLRSHVVNRRFCDHAQAPQVIDGIVVHKRSLDKVKKGGSVMPVTGNGDVVLNPPCRPARS